MLCDGERLSCGGFCALGEMREKMADPVSLTITIAQTAIVKLLPLVIDFAKTAKSCKRQWESLKEQLTLLQPILERALQRTGAEPVIQSTWLQNVALVAHDALKIITDCDERVLSNLFKSYFMAQKIVGIQERFKKLYEQSVPVVVSQNMALQENIKQMESEMKKQTEILEEMRILIIELSTTTKRSLSEMNSTPVLVSHQIPTRVYPGFRPWSIGSMVEASSSSVLAAQMESDDIAATVGKQQKKFFGLEKQSKEPGSACLKWCTCFEFLQMPWWNPVPFSAI